MTTDKKKGLGKGISALMSGFDFDSQTEDILTKTLKEDKKNTSLSVIMVSLDKIRTNPNQPRKYFDEEGLKELSESIKSQGIIQPLTVEEIAPGEYSIIAGERRYRAAKMAGLEKVPAIVMSLTDVERIQVSLIENIQRENLNALEEAQAYQYLIDKTGFTQETVAEKVGKSRSTITNSLRLLSLNKEEKDDIVSGALSAGHARALLSLVNPSDRILLRDKIINEGLSVRDSEELAKEYNEGHKIKAKAKEKKKDEETERAEDKFTSASGLRCAITGSVSKGKLIIKFKNTRELEKIYSLISSGDILFND